MYKNYPNLFKLDKSLFNDSTVITSLNIFNNFKTTNDIKELNILSKYIDTLYEPNLKNIQSKLKIEYGNFQEEYPEQLMSTIFLNSESKDWKKFNDNCIYC